MYVLRQQGSRKRIGNRSNTGSQADRTASNGDPITPRPALRGFGQVRGSNVASRATDTGSSGSSERWDTVKQLAESPYMGDRQSNLPGASEATGRGADGCASGCRRFRFYRHLVPLTKRASPRALVENVRSRDASTDVGLPTGVLQQSSRQWRMPLCLLAPRSSFSSHL